MRGGVATAAVCKAGLAAPSQGSPSSLDLPCFTEQTPSASQWLAHLPPWVGQTLLQGGDGVFCSWRPSTLSLENTRTHNLCPLWELETN